MLTCLKKVVFVTGNDIPFPALLKFKEVGFKITQKFIHFKACEVYVEF